MSLRVRFYLSLYGSSEICSYVVTLHSVETKCSQVVEDVPRLEYSAIQYSEAADSMSYLMPRKNVHRPYSFLPSFFLSISLSLPPSLNVTRLLELQNLALRPSSSKRK